MTKIEKYLFTGFDICFALENSSNELHYIKGMHIGHLQTLFCILTAVILIFIAPAYSKVRYRGSTFRPFVRSSVRPSTIYVKVLTL